MFNVILISEKEKDQEYFFKFLQFETKLPRALVEKVIYYKSQRTCRYR